jgi:hypothetical protein
VDVASRQFFTKKDMNVLPRPPYFSLFPQLKIKLTDHPFDIIEVMKAESQAVLNVLPEHDSNLTEVPFVLLYIRIVMLEYSVHVFMELLTGIQRLYSGR